MGDFNAIREDWERIGGNPRSVSAMEEFNDCHDTWGLMEFASQALRMTWCNGQEEGGDPTFPKKTKKKWLSEGDQNSKFFHVVVSQWRKDSNFSNATKWWDNAQFSRKNSSWGYKVVSKLSCW